MEHTYPIRVLCVFSCLDRGGAETLWMNVYRSIDRSIIQFDFVKHTLDKGAYEDEIVQLGGRIYTAPKYRIYNTVSYLSWWKKHFNNHPEHIIVHGHYYTISGVYFKLAKKMGRITVGHSHNTAPSVISVKNTLLKIMVKRVERVSDYCLACSNAAGVWVFPHKDFAVLNNAIDTKKFTYNEDSRNRINKELGIKDSFVVGHIGRFFPQKNHAFIIDIFKEIHSVNSNSVLVLVGDGKLKSDIEKRIYDCGLKDSVILTGVREDTCDLIQAFDVFLFPSLWEGLGIVAVEAQASGLHTICSDVVPKEVRLTELVEFVSLDKSAEEWANIVLKYDNGYKREDTSLKLISAGYDIHTIVRQLQEFYTNAIRRRH